VDFNWFKEQLNALVVVDGRNLHEPQQVRDTGLLQFAVGRDDSVISK